jgi:hypothetical protein
MTMGNDPCGGCGSAACARQSPKFCRHGKARPAPAPGTVVVDQSTNDHPAVVRDVTLTSDHGDPVFRPTARGGNRKARS